MDCPIPMFMPQHPTPLLKCFTFINIASIIYALSSPSWLGVWVSIELNLYSFIFIIILSDIPSSSQLPTNNAIIYFLIQAISSLLLILSVIILFNSQTSTTFLYQFMLLFALIIKLGAAPFHFWVPWVVTNTSWPITFWVLSVQKITPLLIIYNTTILTNFQITPLFFTIIALSAFLGGLLGLFQTRLQPLLAYSSINQTAWIILAANYSLYLLLFYFFFYSITILTICGILHKNFSISPSSVPISTQLSPTLKLNLSFLFLILAGIPPSIIFLFKANIFLSLFSRPEFLYLTPFLITGALLTTFFYLQTILFLLTPPLTPIKTTQTNHTGFIIFITPIIFLSGPLFIFINSIY